MILFYFFFSLFSLSICGLWAGGPASAPQRKRKQKRRERLIWFILSLLSFGCVGASLFCGVAAEDKLNQGKQRKEWKELNSLICSFRGDGPAAYNPPKEQPNPHRKKTINFISFQFLLFLCWVVQLCWLEERMKIYFNSNW